jgi:hypothetical protein
MATLMPSPALTACPELEMVKDFGECLYSPIDDSPIDDNLLTTPIIGSDDLGVDICVSPIIGDWDGDWDGDFETLFPISNVP